MPNNANNAGSRENDEGTDELAGDLTNTHISAGVDDTAPGPLTKAKTAAEKWFNPLGPPPGSILGARFLKDDQDVFDHNAW